MFCLFVLVCFFKKNAHNSLCFSQTVAEGNRKAAGPKTRFPHFLQIGQFSHVDFFKRVLKCAFNRAAGIRRHVENLVKLRTERRLFM